MSSKYETVYLPLSEAIALEAKQNQERDVKVLGEEDACEFSIYEEEAKHLLETYGEGYVPEIEGHKLVFVMK